EKSLQNLKKSKIIAVNSEDSSEKDNKESLTMNKLKYQEQQLVLKEYALALRKHEAKVYSIELVNLEKEQKLKSAN
ncbi:33111_t:CDS:1, partial [Racocetra persica]